MKISVIIPTYKPKDYLYECLLSLKEQTFDKNDFEIIIILNGCKEPYEKSIRDFVGANLYSWNVTIIQDDKGGVSRARNTAIEVSKGEYLTFLDDDDYVNKDFLHNLYIIANKKNIVVSNFKSFIDGKKDVFYDDYVSNAFKNTKSNDLLTRRSFLSSSCGKLIHRDIIGERRFDTGLKNSEDALFMFSISDRINSIELADTDTIYYRRIRNSSASRKRTPFGKRLKDIAILEYKYMKIYFKAPFKYSFYLYLSRFVATIYYNLITRK